jgi:hypothetical protein
MHFITILGVWRRHRSTRIEPGLGVYIMKHFLSFSLALQTNKIEHLYLPAKYLHPLE